MDYDEINNNYDEQENKTKISYKKDYLHSLMDAFGNGRRNHLCLVQRS